MCSCYYPYRCKKHAIDAAFLHKRPGHDKSTQPLQDHEEVDPTTGETYVTSPNPPLGEAIAMLLLLVPIMIVAIASALSIRF